MSGFHAARVVSLVHLESKVMDSKSKKTEYHVYSNVVNTFRAKLNMNKGTSIGITRGIGSGQADDLDTSYDGSISAGRNNDLGLSDETSCREGIGGVANSQRNNVLSTTSSRHLVSGTKRDPCRCTRTSC